MLDFRSWVWYNIKGGRKLGVLPSSKITGRDVRETVDVGRFAYIDGRSFCEKIKKDFQNLLTIQ